MRRVITILISVAALGGCICPRPRPTDTMNDRQKCWISCCANPSGASDCSCATSDPNCDAVCPAGQVFDYGTWECR